MIEWHRRGTRYGISVDAADGLLKAGVAGVQLTWMDAKVGDWVVTPRIGKPVEINALWYNALRIMSAFAARLAMPDDFSAPAQAAKRAFARFVRADGKGLYE
jgi:4-alpha-glucanotransferase